MTDAAESVLQTETIAVELLSLLRSLPKECRLLLLNEKYGLDIKQKNTLAEITHKIEASDDTSNIVQDLIEIKDCSSNVHQENFIELCRKYGMKDLDFQISIKMAATRCLMELPEEFTNIKVVSSVNAQKQFEVLKGKETDIKIQLKNAHTQQIKDVLQTYLEANRNYIVNLQQVGSDIILTAHIEQRRKTITTISSGSKISDLTFTPAAKLEAKYNTTSNKIHLKCGNQKKLKECIVQTLGQVLFNDNNHFSDKKNKSYSLDTLITDDYELNIDDELQQNVVSASIIEQTLVIPNNDEQVVLTVKSKDTDQFLSLLSNGKIDLKKQKRTSVTIEIILKEKNQQKVKDKKIKSEQEVEAGFIEKSIRVIVSDDSRINFNPKYYQIVQICLMKWGIQLG